MSGATEPGDQQTPPIDAVSRESMRERLHSRAAMDGAPEDGGTADNVGPDAADRRQGDPDQGEPDPVDPDLLEAVRQLGLTGRAGLGAARDTAKSLRSLVSADISLARSALGRTLALTGFAIAFGGSAWLLLMATLVVVLSGPLGMPWSLALLIPSLLSVTVTAITAWLAMRYFDHTRLQATRRQLARLGIGELADFVPDPDSATSARDVTREQFHDSPGGEPRKDQQGVSVTPP